MLATPDPFPARGEFPRGSTIGTIYDDAPPIVIHENVLDEILAHSESDTSRELGGFLAGGLRVEGREHIDLRRFVPAVDTRSRAASLTFTHETWSAATREIESHNSEDMLLGWHHTHPNFGVFLSAYDLFIHRHFFGQPWQIALVVDPCRRELGFFQWRRGEIVDCGFLCVPAA